MKQEHLTGMIVTEVSLEISDEETRVLREAQAVFFKAQQKASRNFVRANAYVTQMTDDERERFRISWRRRGDVSSLVNHGTWTWTNRRGT